MADEDGVCILYSNGSTPELQSDLQVICLASNNRTRLPDHVEQAIETTWAARCSANLTLWNGSKFRLASVNATANGSIIWNLGLTNYKDFIGTNLSPQAEEIHALGREKYGNAQSYMSDPLGVGALLLTTDNYVVILKRSGTCAEAPDLYDVPGGHPEPEEITGKQNIDDVDYSLFTTDLLRTEIFSSILREIRDEVNLPMESLGEPQLLGVALNIHSHWRPSSEYIVRTSLTAEQVTGLYNEGSQAEADESTNIKLIPHEQLLTIKQSPLWDVLAPSARGDYAAQHPPVINRKYKSSKSRRLVNALHTLLLLSVSEMLKRKVKANIEHVLNAKRKAAEEKLDVLFTSAGIARPSNLEECLLYIQGLVDWRIFCDKIPAVVLKSQIYALFIDHTFIDSQINKLRCEGHIIIIKLDSGTYGLVGRDEYLNTVRRQMDDGELNKCVGADFISFCERDKLDIEITAKQLSIHLKGHVTELVRAGYMTSELSGMYYLTIPNASLFLRTLNGGLAYVKSAIKKARFQEMLLTLLLEKEGRKTKKLGMTYYCLALIGSEEVKTVATSSGPLLRLINDS